MVFSIGKRKSSISKTEFYWLFMTAGCYTRVDKGQSYSGPVDFTASGKRCAKWENELHNYCRNPVGQRRKPWCWTKDGSIEECDIEICGMFCHTV